MDKIPTMAKKTLIVDTGSWTIDIMPVINKSPDESKGVTIPKGLIICMRSINEQCVRQLKSDATESANASNGSAGAKPVRDPEREKPKWEDTITNRMLHWSYTPEQKEEVKKALAAGIPKATIRTYFYLKVTVEKMSSYRKKQ